MSQALSAIITAEQLHAGLEDPSLLIVDVCSVEEFETAHIPGAVQIDYAAFVTAHPPIMGLVPEADQLSLVLSAIGLGADQHVIAYDREGGGKAGRLLFTLDAIGHRSNSLLNGGLQAWLGAGYSTAAGMPPIEHSQYVAELRGNNLADKAYIQSRLGDSDVTLLDCRSPAEYAGQDVRAARGGHIPGAVNFNWTDAIDPNQAPLLLDEVTLAAKFSDLGLSPDKEVIAYCQTHHRSSHTYMVLRQLGYTRLKGYPGAWSEWGNDPQTPIEA